MDYKIIGIIPNHEELLEWANEQFNDGQAVGHSYSNLVYRADDRWFNWKSNLQRMVADKRGYYLHRITKAPGDNRLNELGNRILPGFHSGLLRRYQPPLNFKGKKLKGGYIGWHSDHGCFEGWLGMVNIGCDATLCLSSDRQSNPFSDQKNYEEIKLKPGHVICFNSKIAHRCLPCVGDRYSLTFRKFKSNWEKWQPGSEFLSEFSPGSRAKSS